MIKKSLSQKALVRQLRNIGARWKSNISTLVIRDEEPHFNFAAQSNNLITT